MAERVPTRLTAAEGRRFGVTVGCAFLVIAGLSAWRDHTNLAAGAGLIGAALVAGGLVIPTHLGPVERAWMALAKVLSRVTTPVVMGVMYLAVLTTVGLLRRSLARNPLVHKEHEGSFWQSRQTRTSRAEGMRHQF